MRSLLSAAIAATLTVLTASALAQVEVADPWVRATVPSQMATGAFMTITARSNARLVGASSPVAGVVEVHEMALENNVMRMRAITALDLPAGRGVALKPGGYHVMLMDLKQQLKIGDMVPITLEIEQGGQRQKLEVAASVRGLQAGAGSAQKKQ
ncbi:MAG: copper chaperone PCu(A)C [Burkholderiaceae bacterium]|jgi:hypothetical protein|nr:copper chaperone PCu(A)C [Burkholderiaceae bacterium]